MASTTIEIIQGDITAQAVDAIVNAANDHLWMGGGVAGAIVRKGGREIEGEAIRQGPIAVGQSVVTSGGALPAAHVIHAAAMGQDLRTDAGKIRQATGSALTLAEKFSLKSLAFPALGTGVGGFSAEACAEIMIGVVRGRADTANAVPLVRFVLFDDAAYRAFMRVAQR